MNSEKVCVPFSLPLVMILAAVYFGAAANVHAGTITRDITFVDSPPKMAPMKATKDQDYCGETLPDESYLVDANARLKNVVVFLEAAQPAIPADPQKLNVIENSGSLRPARACHAKRRALESQEQRSKTAHSALVPQRKTVFMLSQPFKNTILYATQKIRDARILKLGL